MQSRHACVFERMGAFTPMRRGGGGFSQHMRLGTCLTMAPAHISVQAGVMDFLYYVRYRCTETRNNPSVWGLWPGGRGSQHFPFQSCEPYGTVRQAQESLLGKRCCFVVCVLPTRHCALCDRKVPTVL